MNELEERIVDAARAGDISGVQGILDATTKKGVLGYVFSKITGDQFDDQLMPDDRSKALSAAAGAGHRDVVELLLPLSDPTYIHCQPLRAAADAGHAEIVGLLIPHSDPNALEGDALRKAAGNGHLEVVRQLLPHSDPTEWSSGAIRKAAMNGHTDVVDCLYEHSDIDEALKFVPDADQQNSGVKYLKNRRLSETEGARLQLETRQAAGAWSPDPKEADAQFDRRFAEAVAQSQGVEPQRQQATARMRL